MSEIGNKLKMTIFGESHGAAIGLTLSGLPAGEKIDMSEVLCQMARRAPGNPAIGTARSEADTPEFLSGIMNNTTTGAPLCAVIRNTNQRSGDYDNLKFVPRPGHADYTAFLKYGGAADMRGGGHFSGRLTAPLVLAGAICRQILSRRDVFIGAHALNIGQINDDPMDSVSNDAEQLKKLSTDTFPVINSAAKEKMLSEMSLSRKQCDSIGGVVECKVIGLPAGLGGPLFDGIEGRLSQYIFGIPAVKGVEFGAGFNAAKMKGSENNDDFIIIGDEIKTETNNCGGILGGITNKMPLILRAAFKPTPSIAKPQKSVDLKSRTEEILEIKGRHDPCVVPRAIPCVESAVAVALCDLLIEEGII
jgi:chorismate synthase